jgi:hypothetical protein
MTPLAQTASELDVAVAPTQAASWARGSSCCPGIPGAVDGELRSSQLTERRGMTDELSLLIIRPNGSSQ